MLGIDVDLGEGAPSIARDSASTSSAGLPTWGGVARAGRVTPATSTAPEASAIQDLTRMSNPPYRGSIPLEDKYPPPGSTSRWRSATRLDVGDALLHVDAREEDATDDEEDDKGEDRHPIGAEELQGKAEDERAEQ